MDKGKVNTDQPLIVTHDLNFSFGKRQILSNLNLVVPRGSIYGFLGPNGAGKTTTIKCLLGLYQVTPGMIQIFNKDLNSNRLYILARTGNMVEEPSLYGHISAYGNMAILATLRDFPKKRILETLELVGLSGDANRPVKQFSSGMKQRLCLAMALLHEPELLILDEPINGMDPGGIIEIRNLLQELSEKKGVTIFISSHILSEIEKLCSHVAIIHKGSLLFQGAIEKLPARRKGNLEVILETADHRLSIELIEKQYTVKEMDNKLHIIVDNKEDIARIIHILVSHNISVYQAKPEVNDLESAFLDLIQQ